MAGPDALALVGLALAFAAGAACGAVQFVGLWVTLRRVATARHPAWTVAASLLVRLAVTGAAFAGLLVIGGWPWALSGLAGFVLVRHVAVWRLGRPAASRTERWP